MSSKFILRASGSQYHFTLLAQNHEPILTSAEYADKAAARNAVQAVMGIARLDERYDRRFSREGGPYFVLRASNGTPLGTSEVYGSPLQREVAIAAVKVNAPDAPFIDLTQGESFPDT